MGSETITINWNTHLPTGNWWTTGTRGSRMQRAARAREQRTAAWVLTTAALRTHEWGTPVSRADVLIMVRRPRLMDSDGAVRACKHLRDGIACALGGFLPEQHAPDGPNDPYTWSVTQEQGKDLVTIEIST